MSYKDETKELDTCLDRWGNESVCDADKVVITWGESILSPMAIRTETAGKIIEALVDDKLKPIIIKIRQEKDKSRRNVLKKGLGYFLMGKFKEKRSNEKMEFMTGMVQDYDNVTDPYHFIQQVIPKFEHIWLTFISPSGKGFKVVFLFDRLITDETEFRRIYGWVKSKMDKALGIVSDNTPEPGRASFISYDPNAYVNASAKRLSVDAVLDKVRLREENTELRRNDDETDKYPSNSRCISALPSKATTCVGKKERQAVTHVSTYEDDFARARHIITELAKIRFEYKDFFKVGMALYSGFGEQGKELWDILKINPNYNDSQQFMDSQWRHCRQVRNVNLATIFYIGGKYGIE